MRKTLEGEGMVKLIVLLLIFISFTLAQNNYCLDFDENSYLRPFDNSTFNITAQDVTISFWVQCDSDSFTTLLWFMGKYQAITDQWYFIQNEDPIRWQIFGQVNGGGSEVNIFKEGTTIVDDVWHHVLIRLDNDDNTNCHWFIDGVKETTYTGQSHNGSNLTNTGLFTVGSRSGSFDVFSKMDELAMWFGDLATDEDVALIYNGGIPTDLSSGIGTLTQPTDYFRFEEGSGQECANSGSNSTILYLGSNLSAYDGNDPKWISSEIGWDSGDRPGFGRFDTFDVSGGF